MSKQVIELMAADVDAEIKKFKNQISAIAEKYEQKESTFIETVAEYFFLKTFEKEGV